MAVTAANDPQAIHASSRGRRAGRFRAERDRPRPAELEAKARVGEAAHPAVIAAVTVIVGFIVALLRRPETLTRPQFFNEDGSVFFVGTYLHAPLEWILTPYAGYLHVIPKLVGYAERGVPVAMAPLVGNLFALAVTAAVAAFLVAGPLPGARGLRIALAAVVILAPTSWEVSGSLTYVQFYLAVFLFAFAFAERPSRLWLVLLIPIALSGPYSMLVAPVYLVRVIRDRSFWPFAMTIGAAAVLTGLLVLTSGRSVNAPLGNLPWNVIRRLVIAPILGQPLIAQAWAPALVPVAILLLGLFVAAMRAVPRSWLLVFGYAFTVTAAIALFVRGDGSILDGDLLYSGRYFFAPALIVASLIVMAAWRRPRNPAAVALAALLCLGLVSAFRIDPMPSTGWPAGAECIGGPAPCTLTGWAENWPIIWPGLVPR